MSTSPVALTCIDHIEVFVPDRYEAAGWYQRILRLEIMRGPVWDWAVKLPGGPLFLANRSGTVKVSLFEGEPLSSREPIGQLQTCFSVGADNFLRFMDHLDEYNLSNRYGDRVTANQISDHRVAWAFYFTDPYGNRYELNTYDYATVQRSLQAANPNQGPIDHSLLAIIDARRQPRLFAAIRRAETVVL
ncbi:MAG: hypothetical protein NVS2B16_24190 [Chloroflexota bacterium]